MIKKVINKIISLINESVSRFKMSTLFIALLTVLASIMVVFEIDDEIYGELLFALGAGLIASVFCSLVVERFNIKKGFFFEIGFSILFAIINFFVIDNGSESIYILMALGTAWLILIILSAAILYDYKAKKEMLLHLLKSLFYCYIVTSVIFGGLSICLLAWNYLIIEIHNIYKCYFILAIVSEITIPVLMFLSFIPRKDEEVTIKKAPSVIVNRVGLVVYLLLITILLIYLVKIIVTWKLPVGQINWFASFALLFYVFFYLSTQFEENKLCVAFKKYGSIALLAIYIVQAIAIYIRVHDYGLTTARYASILLNLIALAFIIGSIFKAETKYLLIVTAFVVLVGGVGPFNIIDVPVRSQLSILNKVLSANGMLVDGKIVANASLSKEDQEKVISATNYLRYEDSKLINEQLHFALTSENNFIETFGFSYSYWNDTPADIIEYVYFYSNEDFEYDIRSYSRIKEISNVEDEEIKDFMYQCYLKYGTHHYETIEYHHSDGNTYIFTSAEMRIKNNEIDYFICKGYILIP